jgi:hypothetical protein
LAVVPPVPPERSPRASCRLFAVGCHPDRGCVSVDEGSACFLDFAEISETPFLLRLGID